MEVKGGGGGEGRGCLGTLAQFGVSKSDFNLSCMLADLQPFGSHSVYS